MPIICCSKYWKLNGHHKVGELSIVSISLEGSRRRVTVVQVTFGFFPLSDKISQFHLALNSAVPLADEKQRLLRAQQSLLVLGKAKEFHCLAGGCNFENSFLIKFSSPWFLSDMLIKLTREVSGLDSSFILRLLQTGNKCRCAYSTVARGKASKFLTCEYTGVFNSEKENRGMLFLRHCGQGRSANVLEEESWMPQQRVARVWQTDCVSNYFCIPCWPLSAGLDFWWKNLI